MTPKDNIFKVQGLLLGGFQVFDEVTYIPLRRITMLFGPNSAGKSAVEDALRVFEELFIPGHRPCRRHEPILQAFDDLFDNPFERLSRHWRRTGENHEDYAKRLTVGCRLTTECSLDSALASNISRDYRADPNVHGTDGTDYPEYPFSVDVLFGFDIYETDAMELSATRIFSISVGEKPVTELRQHEYLRVNFSHPILAPIVPAVNFEQAAAKYPDIVRFENGDVEIRSTSMFCDKHGQVDLSSVSFQLTSVLKMPVPDDLAAVLAEVALFYDEFDGLVRRNTSFSLSCVPASRTIPSDRDLQFLFEPEFPLERLDGFDLGEMGDPKFEPLAHSLASSVLSPHDPGDKKSQETALGERLNRMLSEHLFVERGYHITFDHRVLLSELEYDAVVHGQSVRPHFEENHVLVRLMLVDPQRRRFSFGEVGSGLGYVLPVLCAVCDKNASFVLLQQPELHLHPALQAALGDVFIECSSDENQLVVESHSEHILLRLLKRIRQSGGSAPLPEELRLGADDVSVLYFDPLFDGTTRVVRLRISEDGDFMDRWPRGFFAERDMELLDE